MSQLYATQGSQSLRWFSGETALGDSASKRPQFVQSPEQQEVKIGYKSGFRWKMKRLETREPPESSDLSFQRWWAWKSSFCSAFNASKFTVWNTESYTAHSLRATLSATVDRVIIDSDTVPVLEPFCSDSMVHKSKSSCYFCWDRSRAIECIVSHGPFFWQHPIKL